MGVIVKNFTAGNLTLEAAYLQVPKNQAVRLNNPEIKVHVFACLDTRAKGLPPIMDLHIQLDAEVIDSVSILRAAYDKIKELYQGSKDHKVSLQKTEVPKITGARIEAGFLVAEGELTQSDDSLILSTGEVIREGKKFTIKSPSRFATLQVTREDELPSEVIYLKDYITPLTE